MNIILKHTLMYKKQCKIILVVFIMLLTHLIFLDDHNEYL
jgi:hypothetical protein